MNFTPAAEATGAVVAAITDDQLGLPTPSPDHTVGSLLAHVDALSVGLAYTARKATAPRHRDAPAIDRLVGLTGRDPNWRP